MASSHILAHTDENDVLIGVCITYDIIMRKYNRAVTVVDQIGKDLASSTALCLPGQQK
jgi:uncharacterized metal-binding protein